MEKKNILGVRYLEEMLSGAERHRAVPKPAGKLNWDASPRAGSIHLSYKHATNSEKTHFPAPRIAILRLVQLCGKVTDFKTGSLFLPAPLPLPLHHGNVAAGCLGVGVIPNHGLPSGDGDPAAGCRSQDSRAGPILGRPVGLRAGAEREDSGRRRAGSGDRGVKLVEKAGDRQ